MRYLFLFDIDGTILRLKQYRSKRIFRKVFSDMFSVDVPEQLMPNFSGMTDLQIVADICSVGEITLESVLIRIDELWERLIYEFDDESVRENIVLLPAIDSLISHLHISEEAKLALVTGNFRANAYLKLDTYQLSDYFPVGAFGCDYADRNLLPKLAIDRANQLWNSSFTNKNAVIIGDSPNDIICAKANDILSVAVATGFHSIDELIEYQPDLLFESFADYENNLNEIYTRLHK